MLDQALGLDQERLYGALATSKAAASEAR